MNHDKPCEYQVRVYVFVYILLETVSIFKDETSDQSRYFIHLIFRIVQIDDHQQNETLHWRHNDRDGVSNHQPRGCLLNRSGADERKHQSSASMAFVRGNSPGPVNSPHKGPVTRKMFPFDDVIMKNHHLIGAHPCDGAHSWLQPFVCRILSNQSTWAWISNHTRYCLYDVIPHQYNYSKTK